MAKCVSDAVEGVLKKLKTEVMDPQINQKTEEITALKTEINLRDEQVNSLLSSDKLKSNNYTVSFGHNCSLSSNQTTLYRLFHFLKRYQPSTFASTLTATIMPKFVSQNL